jgi:phosphoribosylglycinamide formyltransferase 1
MNRVAIFASGTGTNAIKLLEASRNLAQVEIPCLIIDSLQSPLPEIIKHDFPEVQAFLILPDKELQVAKRRADHEERILEVLTKNRIQWIFLAGYMRLIGPTLLQNSKRIVNIHPSLLPLYPGLLSYERAFEDGIKESGVTLHWVDAGLDTGPIICQEKFPRLPTDSLQDFINRGKEIEWKIYPALLQELNDTSKIAGVSYES